MELEDKTRTHGESGDTERNGIENNQDMETNSTVEKNNHVTMNSDMPAQIEKHLDFIEANSNGHVLLGSSNLTGRYWCGSLWLFTDPTVAPDISGSKAGIEFSGGVTDCAFINKDRAIVAEDGGIINFITIKNAFDKNPQLIKTQQIEEHSLAISSVKVTCNQKWAITASMDTSIRIWDCETTISTRHFSPAHTQEVSSISAHPTQRDIFLSSSLDGNVLLWDLRCPKPASCVFRDLEDCPNCVSWLDDSKFLTGTLSGKIHLRNHTVRTHSLFTEKTFKRSIFRMKSNNSRSDYIAVCGNDTDVKVVVVEGEVIKTKYENNQHNDFVRGVTWMDESHLLSCGWDKKVKLHQLVD